MNKKILSIFALIMAISILGVSCAKDNNTTAPTNNNGESDVSDGTGALKIKTEGKGTSTSNPLTYTIAGDEDSDANKTAEALNITSEDANFNLFTYAVTKVEKKDGDGVLNTGNAALTEANYAFNESSDKKVQLKKNAIDALSAALNGETPKTVTLKLTIQASHSSTTEDFTVYVKVTGKKTPTIDATVTPNQVLTTTLLADANADLETGAAINITFTDPSNGTGVKYIVTGVTGLTTGTDASTVDMSAAYTSPTIANYTIDTTKKITIKKEEIDALRKAIPDAESDGTAGIGVIEVTFKIEADGYNALENQKVRVKITGYKA